MKRANSESQTEKRDAKMQTNTRKEHSSSTRKCIAWGKNEEEQIDSCIQNIVCKLKTYLSSKSMITIESCTDAANVPFNCLTNLHTHNFLTFAHGKIVKI